MIYHITERDEWENSDKYYCPVSFNNDGFIHCSTNDKIEESANKFFKGKSVILVLSIDEKKVSAEIKWEDLYGLNCLFPHIYGRLNRESVISVTEIHSDENGEFKL